MFQMFTEPEVIKEKVQPAPSKKATKRACLSVNIFWLKNVSFKG